MSQPGDTLRPNRKGICAEVAGGYRRELREGKAANTDETGMRIEGENQ